MMCTSCGSFLKALLYDYNLNRKWITLCCWSKIDSSMLLQERCHCTSRVHVCGRMWNGQYICGVGSIYGVYLRTVYAAVYKL